MFDHPFNMASSEITDTTMTDTSGPSATAHAYQLAMSQQVPPPSSVPTSSSLSADPAHSVPEPTRDTMPTSSLPEVADSPAPAPALNAASPAPPRMGTPVRKENGTDVSSRAASQHPDPALAMLTEAPPHGGPTRQYLNSKVTPPLLDGLKMLVKEQPRDPLRVLGEFLIQRSRELEGA